MRAALYALLAVVAAAAAVLSFNALWSLAVMCKVAPGWLLPVVVDAGAAAGTLVWLAGKAGAAARKFACALALILLGLSVAANALGHVLALRAPAAPPWGVVAVASGIAPAVLGAIVHLVVLWLTEARDASSGARDVDTPAADRIGQDNTASPAADVRDPTGPPGVAECGGDVAELAPDPGGRAAELIAAGKGRRVISRETGIPEHRVRELIAASRNGSG